MTYENVILNQNDPEITLQLAYNDVTVERHPVILMMGSIEQGSLPDWSTRLVDEGYMLAAFSAAHQPDPDPSRRPQWLFFDQRFAHGYTLGGMRAPTDAGRVIDYLISRPDVHADKIGWIGSSSTAIPGLSVAVHEPRLAAIVAFVATGSYREWFRTWHTNKLWQGETDDLWPETLQILDEWDPVLHVGSMFPTAVLMVSGGDDKVVDPDTARTFIQTVSLYYESDPERLRLVVYEGFGHNLPPDVVRMYAEHWFRLYMHPTQPPPASSIEPKDLEERAARTRINATDHKDVVGAG